MNVLSRIRDRRALRRISGASLVRPIDERRVASPVVVDRLIASGQVAVCGQIGREGARLLRPVGKS